MYKKDVFVESSLTHAASYCSVLSASSNGLQCFQPFGLRSFTETVECLEDFETICNSEISYQIKVLIAHAI